MYRRSRPIMGTFFEIALSLPETEAQGLVSNAFKQAESLAYDLSRFEPEGWLRRKLKGLSVESRPEFESLLDWALALEKRSDGAFLAGDLTGVAKGFIVDQVAEFLLYRDPALTGVINAGGDMRFLGESPREVTVRGVNHQCNITVRKCAVATSVWESPHPSTQYPLPLVAWIGPRDAVSVSANSCRMADALTKLVMFGSAERAEELFADGAADLFILRENGETLVNRFHS